MTLRPIVSLALVGAALTLSSRAAAQAVDPGPTEAGCARGDVDAFDHAGRLYQDRQFSAAAAELAPLFERCPAPAVAFYLAASWRAVGRAQDAIGMFERYLGSENPAHADDVRRDLVALRASRVRLELRVSPAGATVTVDGRPLPSATDAAWLDPVAHVIEVSHPGHTAMRQEVAPQVGGRVVLAFELRPLPQVGRLVVEPSPLDARVLVNGVEVGRGAVARDLPPGDFYVEVTAPEHAAWRRRVTVRAGAELRLSAALERPSRPGWIIPTIVAGGAVVLAGSIAAIAWFTRGTEPPLEPNWGNARVP